MAERMCANVHERISVLQTPPISPTHLTHMTLKRNPSAALTFERENIYRYSICSMKEIACEKKKKQKLTRLVINL